MSWLRLPFRLPSLFQKQRLHSVVGIDIGADAIRALRARSGVDRLFVDDIRVLPYEDDSEGLVEAWRDALAIVRPDDRVVVAVGSASLAVRKIELPPMSQQEMREALPWEAKRHIAGLADDALLDFQELSHGDDGKLGALLVAFPADAWRFARQAWEKTGIEPAFVDARALASLNAILDARAPDQTTACLDVSAGMASFTIFSAGSLYLHRDLTSRVETIDHRLATAFHLSRDDLARFRADHVLPDGRSVPSDEARTVIEDVATDLVDDVRAGQLYVESRVGRPLDRVVVTGSWARLLEFAGVLDSLRDQASLAVELATPLDALAPGQAHDDPAWSAAAGIVRRALAPEPGMFVIDLSRATHGSSPTREPGLSVPDLLLAWALPVALVVAAVAIPTMLASWRNEQAETTRTRVEALQRTLAERRAVLASATGRARDQVGIKLEEVYWSDLVRLIGETIPDKLWVEGIRTVETPSSREGEVAAHLRIEGGLLSHEDEPNLPLIGRWLARLETDRRWTDAFGPPKLESVNRSGTSPFRLEFVVTAEQKAR